MADPTQMPVQPAYLGQDQNGTPYYRQQGGISDAIANAIWMMARMAAPKSLTQRDAQVNQTVNQATAPGQAPLGQQF
jgi:hypothetical protein